MAPIVRRRKFTIFIIISCISLIIISWYFSKYNARTLNNKIMTDVDESILPINRAQDIIEEKLPIPEQKSESYAVKQSQIVTHLEEQDLNEKEAHISEQRTEHSVISESQIVTQLTESTKADDLYKYINHNREDASVRFAAEYEIEIEKGKEEHNILDLLDQLPELIRKEPRGNVYDEALNKMPDVKHNELNKYLQSKDIHLKNGEKLTTDDVNYSIEKLEDCDECKGYLYETTLSGTEMIETTKNPSLLIDTPGCKIPRLDPWDKSVKDLIQIQDPYICRGPPLFMRSNPGGSISLNEAVLQQYYDMNADELVCHYHPIYRKHEKPRHVREEEFGVGNKSKLEFEVPINEDYIGAGCDIKNRNTTFVQFFPLVRLRKELEEERNARTPPKPQLNVILLGIDSVSKFNFLRHFNRTLTFLNEKMSPFEMNGYTKVGDNTFPNLVPMLTGQFVEHYWDETLKDTMFFDDIDLIWKDYAKRGYRTFYAEDHPHAGTFNYLKRGFYDPPTDYYYRPMALAVQQRIDNHNDDFTQDVDKMICLNSQLETDFIYDYLRDFVKTMDDRPYFAFAMVSIITHNLLNYASFADLPTVNILEDLSNMGAFNNSLLVLFSDHGIRFGSIRHTYIGKFEERMPFMYIHVPKWFLDQYPEFAKNLKTNQDRLMTLFDIHATMVHLLDLNKTHEERSNVTLGTSLFEEIPDTRTCVDANIKQHWCPCETFDPIPLSAPGSIKAAQAILKDINSQLEAYRDICEVLEVDEIMTAMVGKANELVLRYVKAVADQVHKKLILGDKPNPISDLMITLKTKPGGAVFEGTVRYDPSFGSYTVMGISRISLYGSTSWCIDSQRLKLFCYCKVQKET